MKEDWRKRAACKGMDTGMFFQEKRNDLDKQAKQLCASCPVEVACRGYAVKNTLVGVWGGTGERNEWQSAGG